MADSLDAPLRLVLGDEELLVSRAVAEVVTAARDADPETDVRELPAGELTAGDLYDLQERYGLLFDRASLARRA